MTQRTKILKFGGSSLSSPEGLNRVHEIVSECLNEGIQPVVVVSAFAGVTNRLLEMCQLASQGDQSYSDILESLTDLHKQLVDQQIPRENRKEVQERVDTLVHEARELLHGVSLVKDISLKTLDLIASYGEQLAACIVTHYLSQHYQTCCCVDARELIVTDDNFGAASVKLNSSIEKVKSCLGKCGEVRVVTGFIGTAESGQTTTLGRGGSDYTAAVLGAALSAQEIQLWTDVDGVMTANPRKVPKAFTIPYLSYEEAMELCHFGAKVIYPPTMQPALDANIPIRIKNTFNPQLPGSLICTDPPSSSHTVTGISSISEITLIRLEGSGMIGVAGISKRLFDALSKEKISVILISQASSEHSICFAIQPGATERAKKAVEEEFALEMKAHQIEALRVETNYAIIAVVGSNMRNTPGIAGRLFQAMGKNGINVNAIAQGSSELNISVVIERSDESKALNALHDAFFLSDLKTLNLFLVGTGQVGGKLLEQIERQTEHFKECMLDLRIVGLANSRKMLFAPEGIDLGNWRGALEETESAMEPSRFVDTVKNLNLPNSIFVDCTASDTVARCYVPVLGSSISIVTPNKKANSEKFEIYQGLKAQAASANVKFFYETTVGAGLPVIGTLNDLILSGDKILRIEAVLSGTLSYIFNSFTSGRSFSEVVREAKERGYTEPDPRDDLSGTDVARKLLILAREMGIRLELEDIQVESLVPESCQEAENVDQFFLALSEADHIFEERLQGALQNGKALRYIGTVEDGQAQVSLQAVDQSHPFYSLSGSDNVISFVTQRYFERPLVVKGPGAGTDVTAAGVLADIIRVGSYLM